MAQRVPRRTNTRGGEHAAVEPPLPAPPRDLAKRALPLHPAPAGRAIFRIIPIGTNPLFFGPGASEPPAGRFDATNGSFRTCYAGMTPETCFAEKFLRLGERTTEESFLQKIALARIELLQPLTLVALHGQGLSSVSATASAVNGPYASSRLWSAALHAHPQRPDGLCWRSRFDDSRYAEMRPTPVEQRDAEQRNRWRWSSVRHCLWQCRNGGAWH